MCRSKKVVRLWVHIIGYGTVRPGLSDHVRFLSNMSDKPGVE